MQFILHDFNEWQSLQPLTLTRSVADIRMGILTQKEKWSLTLENEVSVCTKEYLQSLYTLNTEGAITIIRSSILPSFELKKAISNLKENTALYSGELLIAACSNNDPRKWNIENFQKVKFENEAINIQFPWDIFTYNHIALDYDFTLLTQGKKGQDISASNTIIGKGKIFIAKSAKCEGVYLNANDGPIYIGDNAEVMEGSMIRGPFSLGDSSQLKMGTKIYGATTIGPHCKVGGEVTNSVIFGYTNKAHDGFLGNSVLGEWCNLGADTNNSNLKNNYGQVKVWSFAEKRMTNTGLQFCGLIMGDHSKSGINTMFNTGTVVGVSSNIFGGGFPDKIIDSFSWGGNDGWQVFDFDKAIEVVEKVMERRKLQLQPEMKLILKKIHNER